VVSAVRATRSEAVHWTASRHGAQAVRCLECGKPYFTGRMVPAATCAVFRLRAAGGLAGIGLKRRSGGGE
jgi:hypothetical protein